jgi:hypothetical protein
MKTTRFLFAMAGCGALTLGLNSMADPMNAQTKRASANELHQSVLKKAATTATAANAGLMMNKMGNHYEPPARLPVGSGTTAPRPGVVRSRSATVAVIGGATASTARHPAAVVDGTAIMRKP